MSLSFHHLDGDQRIVFGADALDAAADLVTFDYVLLTTPRASRSAPRFAERAIRTVDVPHGPVEAVAADLRDLVGTARLVALGGGRVIDVAKAIAAAGGLVGPVAIPTSLSGAEMTGVHRHAKGVPDGTPRSRASLVLNDPALSASQPEPQLAASSANALGHAVTALVSARSTPIAAAVGGDAIARLAAGWAADAPDRTAVALGALLAGWAVGRSGLGPHHALAQAAVRVGGVQHADANAALLEHTLALQRPRATVAMARADAAAGRPVEQLAADLRRRAGRPALRALVADAEMLDRAVEAASAREELDRVAPRPSADDVRAVLRAAGT